MSELAVGSLKGLAANSFVIDVAAGSTLNVPPPAILQVVQTVKTDVFSTSSTSYVDVTGMTATITPSSATSKIFISAQVSHSLAQSEGYGHFKIVRDSADIYVGDSSSNRVRNAFGGTSTGTTNSVQIGGTMIASSIVFLDSPASTSSLTYALQVRQALNGSVAINRSTRDPNNAEGGRGASSITLMEVAG